MARTKAGLRLAATFGVVALTVAALGAGNTASAMAPGEREGSAPAAPAATTPAATTPAATTPAAPARTQPEKFTAPGKKTTMRIGPFSLAPTPLGTLPHQNRIIPKIEQPCEDCFITGIQPRLVYADGRNADMANGVMLHHLVIADTAKRDLTCAREDGVGAIGQRIFASGDERTPFALPDGYGFKVTPGRWIGVIELMNHSPLPQEVYFDADVWTVPASTKGMKNVTPVWLDIANCLDSEYSVPAGKSATDWSWVSSITGKVVAAAGHVHAGGVGTILTNSTTKRRICASEAGYGSPDADGYKADPLANMVTSMSLCSWDSLGSFKAGDRLTLTSLYDTPAAMSGVMGIMLLAVHQTDDLKGGTKAPAKMRATPDTKVPHGVAPDHSLLPTGGHGH
jgi:hypothetical protein